MKQWSDKSILKTLPNPSGDGYEINIKNPEITFLGVKDQPDFVGKGYRTKIKFSINNSNNKKILEEIYKSRIKEKKKAIMVYSATGIILILLVLFLFG